MVNVSLQKTQVTNNRFLFEEYTYLFEDYDQFDVPDSHTLSDSHAPDHDTDTDSALSP